MIAAALVALLDWQRAPVMRRVDLGTFDAWQRLSPRAYDPDTPVRIIAIDRRALERFGQWPWPRPVLARVVERLRDAGAAAIGFDVVFAEADRTSPEEIARSLAAAGLDAGAVLEGEAHDAIFARTLAEAPVVLGAIPVFGGGERAPAIKAKPSFLGSDTGDALPAFPGADVNRPELAAAAQGVGSIALTPEDREDGIVRRTPLAVRAGDEIVPSLALEMLRVAQGARGYLIRSSDAGGELGGGAPVVSGVRVGALEIDTGADGAIWVRYAGTQPERTISAAAVLERDLPALAADVEGRLVLIAATAPGLGDIVATPMASTVPGVEVHAEILEQLVTGVPLTRPDWAAGAERAAVLGIGALVALSFLFLGFTAGAVVAAATIVGAPLASFALFRDAGLLLGPAAPVLSGALAWGSAAAADYLGARRERQEIRRQFEHFVAPEVISEIARDPGRHMAPGGEERELTILFSDVRSFSTISSTMTPSELIAWLNGYLTPMAEAIIDEKGTIDKFIGDAIMAFWNAPRRDPDHARQALNGALAMKGAMDALNARFAEEGRAQATFGVGLNTGICSVGRIGARKRLDYTCIGDAVNVASRVEGLTKTYGVTVLMGEDTARQAPDYALVEIDRVEVKGREGTPFDVYALLGGPQDAKLPAFAEARDGYASALTAWRAGAFRDAERLFDAVIERSATSPFDLSGPARTMLARIADAAFEAAPETWDAVFRAQTK